MRLLVCGGRDFRNRTKLHKAMDFLHAMRPITHVIEGGAEGADRFAGEWARENQVYCTTVKADWSRLGKRAGYERNVQMANMAPDVVLAAPGGKGTKMMIDIALKRGLNVILLSKMALQA